MTSSIKRDFFDKNKEKLLELYSFVKENKGFFEVLANNRLNDFVLSSNYYESKEEARLYLDKYLFHFLEISKTKEEKLNEPSYHYASNLNSIYKIDLLELDSSYIKEIPVIEVNEESSDKEINDKILSALDQDLVILRGFLEHFGLPYNNKNGITVFNKHQALTKEEIKKRTNNNLINPADSANSAISNNTNKSKKNLTENKNKYSISDYTNIFTLDYLKNNSSKIKIDLRTQETNYQGFASNRHSASSVDLSAYIKYIELNEQEQSLTTSKINYGVNFDAVNIPQIYAFLEQKIHPLLNFGSKYDVLAYVRRHIHGMTSPQLYLKVKHAWTGGHEENLRLRSINMSHGPGDSMWWGVGSDYSSKFHDLVSKQFNGFDIYGKEGVWFAPSYYFMKEKINCYFSNQKAGDIVLVGPGCIHWVKALGHSINSSWNFFSKEKKMFEMAIQRYNINRQIRYRNIVQLQTLILDFLNYEFHSIDLNLLGFLYYHLKNFIKDSDTEYEEFMLLPNDAKYKKIFSNVLVQKELDQVVIMDCEMCYDEVFNYYGFCAFCSNTKMSYNLCIKCFTNHILKSKNKCYEEENSLFLFYKYDSTHLKSLISNINNTLKCKKANVFTGPIEELTKKSEFFNEFTLKQAVKQVFSKNKIDLYNNNGNSSSFITTPNVLMLLENKISSSELYYKNLSYKINSTNIDLSCLSKYFELKIDADNSHLMNKQRMSNYEEFNVNFSPKHKPNGEFLNTDLKKNDNHEENIDVKKDLIRMDLAYNNNMYSNSSFYPFKSDLCRIDDNGASKDFSKLGLKSSNTNMFSRFKRDNMKTTNTISNSIKQDLKINENNNINLVSNNTSLYSTKNSNLNEQIYNKISENKNENCESAPQVNENTYSNHDIKYKNSNIDEDFDSLFTKSTNNNSNNFNYNISININKQQQNNINDSTANNQSDISNSNIINETKTKDKSLFQRYQEKKASSLVESFKNKQMEKLNEEIKLIKTSLGNLIIELKKKSFFNKFDDKMKKNVKYICSKLNSIDYRSLNIYSFDQINALVKNLLSETSDNKELNKEVSDCYVKIEEAKK